MFTIPRDIHFKSLQLLPKRGQIKTLRSYKIFFSGQAEVVGGNLFCRAGEEALKVAWWLLVQSEVSYVKHSYTRKKYVRKHYCPFFCLGNLLESLILPIRVYLKSVLLIVYSRSSPLKFKLSIYSYVHHRNKYARP